MRSAHASTSIHPRRLWYWVAGCLLAAAATCITLGIVGFSGLDQQIHDFQRVPVPGHAMVTFTQPGGYVLYIERPGSCCFLNIGSGADDGSSGGPPFARWSMRVALLQVSSGSQVPISTWRGATESYAAAGVQGQTAMYFTIRSPGQYYLTASDVAPRSIADIAAGRGIGHNVLIEVLLVILGLVIFGPAGLLIGGITAYRRHRARRTRPPAPGNALAGLAAAPRVAAGWQPGPPPVHGRPVGDDSTGWASQATGNETAQAAAPAWAPPAAAPPIRPPSAAGGPYQGFGGPACQPAAVPRRAVPPQPAWPTVPPQPTVPQLPATPPPGALPGAADRATRPVSGDRTKPLGRVLWRRKWPLAAGIGVAIVATFLISSVLTGPAPATRSGASTPVRLPGGSAPATQASPAPSTAPEPLTRSERWLDGLTSLNTKMNHALGPDNSVVTPASLRVEARQLRRCPAELAGIGPPSSGQRPLYHLARQACAGFVQGARCYAAAGRDSAGFDPTETRPQPRFNRLLRCGDAGVNKGTGFLSNALSNGAAEG